MIIEDILRNRKLPQNVLNKLDSEKEKQLLSNIIKKSGLSSKYKIKHVNDELKDILDEMDVLKGEVEAGNDSPQVIKRLKQIITYLIKIKHIDKSYGLSLMMTL